MDILLFIATLLFSCCPAVSKASWVRGVGKQQGVSRVVASSNHRKSNNNSQRLGHKPHDGSLASFVEGLCGQRRSGGGPDRQQGSQSRAKHGGGSCTCKPRAMPPLDNSRLSRSSRDRNERYGSSSAAGAAGPLRAIDPDAIYTANDWIAGIAGGSVGVMGTLIQLELKQEKLKTRRNCPYCDGSGKLVCAQCCCSGKFMTKLPGADSTTVLPCPGCSGSKYVECLNCRGDGRAVPRELDRKTADAAEVDLRLEEIGMSNMTR